MSTSNNNNNNNSINPKDARAIMSSKVDDESDASTARQQAVVTESESFHYHFILQKQGRP